MKILIIGAGWVGCHLAGRLIDNHEVAIYDKDGIFENTSYLNQNRLHLGYHYPRSFRTRSLCRETFGKFISEYAQVINCIHNNVYGIPNKGSIIDFETYRSIYTHERYDFSEENYDCITNVDHTINVGERHIDQDKAKSHFTRLLGNIFTKAEVKDIRDYENSYDLIINCTNNFIRDLATPSVYELTVSLIYSRRCDNGFGALTLMDGPFFSIYPYKANLYTVTDVVYTPVLVSDNLNEILNFKITDLQCRKENIEKKIKGYYPDFNHDFEYEYFFTSIKSKTINTVADRYPVIRQENNVINCFTGKIQGIYIIEDEIRRIINESADR